MNSTQTKVAFLLGITLLAFMATLIFLPRIPQDLHYHNFADHRRVWGIPNFSDVVSNLPFLLVSVLGLLFLFKNNEVNHLGKAKWLYVFFFAFVGIIGLGSAYYHWAPDNVTLVWDRLPISLAFMSFLAALIAERINLKAGLSLFIPLIFLGTLSVRYWVYTESQGIGDLRPYAFILFFPFVLVPLILWLFPKKGVKTSYLFYALLGLVASRAFEFWDHPIFEATHEIMSGHTLKHLASAVATYCIFLYVKNRTVDEQPRSKRQGIQPFRD